MGGASHARLRLLAQPTPAERQVLGAFRYTPNPALLHTDDRLLPARGVRASWNYQQRLPFRRLPGRSWPGGPDPDQLPHEPAAAADRS